MKYEEKSRRNKFSKKIFAILAVLFVISVVAQVFLAGLAIFVNPVHWIKHTSFVHLFEFVPVMMLILAIVGKMPRWAIGQSAALFGVIIVMYFTANIITVLPWAAALHPVIAIGLFWMSIKLVRKAWSYAFNSSSKGDVAL
ncbi:DUF6220 domain-containing protein [Neobacillus sp. K501]